MDDSSGFENFYAEKISPSLPRLRNECRQMDSWHLVAVLAGILGFLCFIGYHAEILTGPQASWLFVLFAALLVFSVYKYAQRTDRFTAAFKKAVIKTIIDDVCTGLVYKPDECISTREYKTSSLYRYRYDYFDGDDYIEGIIGNISFHCSELCVKSDYAGNKQIFVFKGLFFVAKINDRFSGGTYVWPRNRAQLATSIMDQRYRLLPMPEVADVHFDDEEFSTQFRVCSTWPEQAKEILSPQVRTSLVSMSRLMNIALSVSFVAGLCYIGVPVRDDLLEPTDYDPGDKIEIKKYFLTIRAVTNIISKSGLSELQ
ncbi:MAG TPA: DUF3137 domain-containing protein [Ferruginibacter sp.]|nr:DUF3137 domain-containing protein [Ferruginibacter sp.]